MSRSFTHLDDQGRVRMVDVSGKPITHRIARAQAVVSMQDEIFNMIQERTIKKGNVLETARIAGIMAAKQTAQIIPMCHPLSLSHVQIDFFPDDRAHTIRIEALAKVTDQTGVEMEALTAASVAALTMYDMCKSYDRSMAISNIFLLEKEGGKSGHWKRPVV